MDRDLPPNMFRREEIFGEQARCSPREAYDSDDVVGDGDFTGRWAVTSRSRASSLLVPFVELRPSGVTSPRARPTTEG